MGSNNEKYQAVGQDDKIDASVKRENDRPSIQGRPNIDEISKRNEEEKKRDRKSSYILIGVPVLLIIVVMFLVYFFS